MNSCWKQEPVLFGDILETYVTILVQTNDYEGVIETVEKVLQTKDIMPEQKEKLAQARFICRRYVK